ncbi:MAG TPA: class I SAM-dependent methyltransferase [Terriglobales bacterium]|nr:class I SAM-dependent methyltransferase [Terriglobales bacterium]
MSSVVRNGVSFPERSTQLNLPSIDKYKLATPAKDPLGKRWFLQIAQRIKENETLFRLFVCTFRVLQRVGLNVSPNHFYWPIPDLNELEGREWPIYLGPGCDLRLDKQLGFIQHVVSEYVGECDFGEEPGSNSDYHFNNGFFETIDAEVAHSMLRHYKPARVIEIGSGYSTRVLARAMQINREFDGVEGELLTIDPHPERLPLAGMEKFVTCLQQRVQDVDLDVFRSLRSGDVLFIDSSHVVGVGSDVVREYLEILPALHPGVVIHIHDIFLPSDYPRRAVLHNLCFWSEQYLLQAFLSFNSSFQVLWASSAMQFFHANFLERYFPRWKHSYRSMPHSKRRFIPSIDHERVWPSSFWIRRCGA